MFKVNWLRKYLKVFGIFFLILGLTFCFVNAFTVDEAEAFALRGSWEFYHDGSKKCTGFGDECTIMNTGYFE